MFSPSRERVSDRPALPVIERAQRWRWLTAVLALGIGIFPALVLAAGEIVFQSDLTAQTKGVSGYGDEVKYDIIQDEEAKQNAARVVFSDQSPQEWCQKGIRVDLPEPVAWSQFEDVSARVKVVPGAKMVGFLAHDISGNFWDAIASEEVSEGEWIPVQVSQDLFRFGYNENDPTAAAPASPAPINYVLVYLRTADVNTGTEYTALIKDVTLSRRPVE